MGVITRHARRFGAIDPWIIVCCGVAIAVYMLHGFDGALSRDLGVYSYAGQQVAEGVPPYVGIFNRAGPLAHLLPGLGVIVARSLGFDDLLGMRVLFMLLAVATVGLIYLLARDLFRSRLAGVVSAAVMVSFEGFIQYASGGPREKTAMVLFLVAALLAMTRQSWVVSGLLVGLATLTWQPVFPPLLAGIITAVLVGVDRGSRLGALGKVALGGLIPATVTVVAFLLVGQLPAFLESFLVVNATYSTQARTLPDLAHMWRDLRSGYGLSLWLLVTGLVGVIAAATRAYLEHRGNSDHRQSALVGVGGYTLVAIAWTLLVFDNWPDVFLLLPSAAIGVGAIISLIEEHARGSLTRAITVGVSAIAVVLACAYALGHPLVDRLVHQRDAVSVLLSAIPGDDETIVSVQAPQALVLSKRQNPSRFQLFGGGNQAYVNAIWPGGIWGYGSWIVEQMPTVIAVGGGRLPLWLRPNLNDEYKRVGCAPGWAWYVTRELGSDRLREIEEAVKAQTESVGGWNCRRAIASSSG